MVDRPIARMALRGFGIRAAGGSFTSEGRVLESALRLGAHFCVQVFGSGTSGGLMVEVT